MWRGIAPLLRAMGHDAWVPDYRGALAGPSPYYDRIVQDIARRADEPSVLIAHSGAGALVPALAEMLPLRTAIFVDALLPHPGRAWFDTVPETLAVHLRALENGGRLPPWNRWWPDAAMEAMLPDAAIRMAVIAEFPALPFSYFEEHAPAISLPDKLACAYLQLSSGYDAEAREAQNRGWQTQHLTLNHLALLTRADEVAGHLQRLIPAAA